MITDKDGNHVDLDALEEKARGLYTLMLEIQELGIVPEWRTNPGINLVIELRRMIDDARQTVSHSHTSVTLR